MFDILGAPGNLPFSVALAVLMLLLLVEIIGFVTGLGASDFIEGLLPEFGDGADVDASFAGHVLGWLLLGRVPALILLAIFLGVFGLLGLTLQGTLSTLADFRLPGWLAALIVIPLSLPLVRWVGLGVARIMPRDETQVASRHSLLGHVGNIVIGSARRASPAQAKVRDEVGQMQYVMVEPENDTDHFDAGDAVLLKSQHGAVFRVVRPDHPGLDP
jgi:hypothetical protein